MSATKKCPNPECGKTLGRSARKCECGQLFGKAATPPKPKKRGKRKPKTARIPVATRKAKVAADERFRVGIFSDGGMAIINERGGLELSPDQAVELASFCREQFAEAEA